MPDQPLTITKEEPLSITKEEPLESAQPATAPPSGGFGRFISTAAEEVNPIMAVKGIVSALKDPKAALEGILAAHQAVGKKAQEEYDKGNYIDAGVHLLNAAIPLLGPKIDELAERGAAGDWTGLLGGATGVGLSLGAPAIIKAAVPARIGIPGMGVARAADAAAATRAEQLGIPIDAATATMNPVVRAGQYAADRSLAGTHIAAAADEAAATATKGAVGKIAQRVSPTPATEETAGAGLRGALKGEIQSQHGIADTGYGKLRSIEAQTPIPVDFGKTRAALQPVYDQMKRQLPVTLQESSPGWTALKQFMEGPTFKRLSDADADLSVIKGMAREGDPYLRSNGQRIAAMLAKSADADIQTAVAKAGPDAVKALAEGRAATRAKYAAADVLGQFAEEPVKAFRQATLRDDAGIERLRSLNKVTPAALPSIGRAYLDDLVSTATADGGFSGPKAWTAWQNLGPETKALLYPDKAMRADLDAIFNVAKRRAMNPNPSGTAHTALMYGELGHLVLSPMTGIPIQIGAGVAAKLMRTPAGVKLLRDGLLLPINHPLAKKAAQTIAAMQPAGRMLSPALTPALAQDQNTPTP